MSKTKLGKQVKYLKIACCRNYITRTNEQIHSILYVVYTDVSYNCPDLNLEREYCAKLIYKTQLVWNFQVANKSHFIN